jgi:molybdenum cofactor biosynthesis enzyme MoaA
VPQVDIAINTLQSILNGHTSINRINLQGLGEPFMHPDFETICKTAKDYGPVFTITNGTIYNEKALKYLDTITVSLDTVNPKKTQSLKGIGYNLSTVIENIDKMSSILPVSVNFVRSFYNFEDEEPVRRFCKDHSITFNLTRVQNWYGIKESGYTEAAKDIALEREMYGPVAPIAAHCQWLNGRSYYYRADGIRNPCCIRMLYNQKNLEHCCDRCPN